MNKLLLRLSISNFFFVSTYVFLGYHTLFIHRNYGSDLKDAVYLGFGIFNALQIGGVWIIQTFLKSFGFSRGFIFLTRLVASLLIFVNHPVAIVVAYTLYGLSSAAYFKKSRDTMKELVLERKISLSNPFIIFSITTNIAIIIMPLFGSYILSLEKFMIVAVLINVFMAFIGLWFFAESTENEGPSVPKVSKPNDYEALHIGDPLRIVMSLLPYTIMVTLPPIKVAEAGLDSKYSSYLYTINGIIVVVAQVFLSKTKAYKFGVLKYDISCLLSVLCCVASYYLDYKYFLVVFGIWSLLESYQIPGIEYLLFQERKYEEKLLNRLLVIDSIVCLGGPMINIIVYKAL